MITIIQVEFLYPDEERKEITHIISMSFVYILIMTTLVDKNFILLQYFRFTKTYLIIIGLW